MPEGRYPYIIITDDKGYVKTEIYQIREGIHAKHLTKVFRSVLYHEGRSAAKARDSVSPSVTE